MVWYIEFMYIGFWGIREGRRVIYLSIDMVVFRLFTGVEELIIYFGGGSDREVSVI